MKKSVNDINSGIPIKKSIKPKLEHFVLFYLLIFTLLIIVLLWIFQIKLMPNYFKSVTIRNVKNTAELADKNITLLDENDFGEYLTEIALDNGFLIIITDGYGYPIGPSGNEMIYDYMGGGKPISRHSYAEELKEPAERIIKSVGTTYYHEDMDEFFHMNRMTYGVQLVEAKDLGEARIIFIRAFIEPIDSTTAIIKEQFFFIVLIVCELSILLSIFISKTLSKPIVKIADSAKDFAQGDYTVKFDEKGFKESSQLAQTLNYAVSEVSKVTELRRELLANVSHDLKTPLTMIKAYAEMIRDLSGDVPEKREEHLGVIIDEADRLTALVCEFLELSKLESNFIELDKTEFSIHEKLSDVMQRYALLIENNGYDISVQTDEDRIICADSAKLDQIIYNLVNNAINYSGDYKKIIIRQTNLGNAVRIDVIDNGIGIAPENLKTIFDRYYRGEKVKRDKVGTGLGLSIVKELFKLHGFSFGVTSTVGEGSDFWFEIPDTKPVE